MHPMPYKDKNKAKAAARAAYQRKKKEDPEGLRTQGREAMARWRSKPENLEKARVRMAEARAADPEKALELSRAQEAKRRELHGEERRQYARDRMKSLRSADPRHVRSLKLKSLYGITLDEFEELETSQGTVCAICKRPEKAFRKGTLCRLAVDHCHETKKIRGLLCSKCNIGIGHFNHDPTLLQAAIQYLQSPPAREFVGH